MARSYRLDIPRETRRSLRGNIDPETFGRLSERFARRERRVSLGMSSR